MYSTITSGRARRLALTGLLATALLAGATPGAQARRAQGGYSKTHAGKRAARGCHAGHAHGNRRGNRIAQPIVSGGRCTLPVGTQVGGHAAGRKAFPSPNGRYRLAMQRDGNLVLRDRRRRTVIWSTQTSGNPGARAILPQHDGNLVVYSNAGSVLYTSATQSPGARLAVQNDGNAVLYSSAGAAIWASHDDVQVVGSGQTLRPDQYRTSADGAYRLQMQGDGNLVLYGPADTVIWSSQTDGHPGAIAKMQTDGNLVVAMPGSATALYDTATQSPGARLAVQNDGNVVLYSTAGNALWASHDEIEVLGSGHTLRPDQYRTSADGAYRLQMQGDGNLVLYAMPAQQPLWASNTGVPGSRAAMQADGNLTVVTPAGAPIFATGTASAGAHLAVQTDGNIVIYSTAGDALWARGRVAPLG